MLGEGLQAVYVSPSPALSPYRGRGEIKGEEKEEEEKKEKEERASAYAAKRGITFVAISSSEVRIWRRSCSP